MKLFSWFKRLKQRAVFNPFPDTPVECPNCHGRLIYVTMFSGKSEYVCDGFRTKSDVKERLSPHWPANVREAFLKRLPEEREAFESFRTSCKDANCQEWKLGNSCGQHGSFGPCGFVGPAETYRREWG